jgi:hypothetical protein
VALPRAAPNLLLLPRGVREYTGNALFKNNLEETIVGSAQRHECLKVMALHVSINPIDTDNIGSVVPVLLSIF